MNGNMNLFQITVCYHAGASILLFLMMFWDKRQAVKRRRRIPERRLLLLGLLGGGAGGLSGLLFFRHKTRKPRFYAVFILGIILQILSIYWLGRNMINA